MYGTGSCIGLDGILARRRAQFTLHIRLRRPRAEWGVESRVRNRTRCRRHRAVGARIDDRNRV